MLLTKLQEETLQMEEIKGSWHICVHYHSKNPCTSEYVLCHMPKLQEMPMIFRSSLNA